MEAQHIRKPTQSGHEGHSGGNHVCHKCGWPFPNPHPSARHRRAHKKVCGTIEGYKLDVDAQDKTHLDGSDGEQHVSDDDEHKTPSMKVKERFTSRRNGSGVGSRSGKSTRSEDEVFADAVTDFVDSPGLEETSGGVIRHENSQQKITENDPDSTRISTEYAVTENMFAPAIHVEDKQPQVQKLKDENDKTEGCMLSQECISSSTNESTPVSTSITIDNASTVEQQPIMQTSELNLDGGEGTETSSKDLSELITTGPEVAGVMSDVCSLREELVATVSADKIVKPAGMRTDGFEGKVECSHEIDSPVNVCASVDSVQVVDSVDGNKGTADMIEEPDSKIDSDENLHVISVPDALPLQEHPKIAVEDLDHKGGKFNMSMAPNATLAFESIANSKDPALEESCCDTEPAKPGEFSGICSQGDGLESFHSTEDMLKQDFGQNKLVVLHGEENQISDAMASNADIGDFNGKEVFDDIKSDTLIKEISSSDGHKCSVSLHTVSLEGDVVGGSDNQETKLNAVVDDKENFVVHENAASQVQMEELTATSSTLVEFAPVKELINALDHNDMGIDGKTEVEGTTLNVNERIGEEEPVTTETGAAYGLTLPGSYEVNVEASELEKNYDDDESRKTLDLGSVMVGHLPLESLPTSEGVGEIRSADDDVLGEERINKDSTSVVKTDGYLDSPSKTIRSGVLEVAGDAVSSFPDSAATADGFTEKVVENVSVAVEVEGTTKEHVAVSTIDALLDSSSQTDSLEGNWGSVSALSAVSVKGQHSESKASGEPQASGLELKEDPSDIHTSQTEQQQSSALHTVWSPSVAHMANNHQAEKRDKEIIAKVTNWGNEKQRTPLKTLLGEATDRSWAESPGHDDNSIPDPRKEEIPITKKGVSYKTENVVLGTEAAAKEEIGKEWNSPARYPVNIKTEKRKAKSRPYWVPFLCCSSSVNAAR